MQCVTSDLWDCKTQIRGSPLHMACQIGNKNISLETVKLLLKYGSDVNDGMLGDTIHNEICDAGTIKILSYLGCKAMDNDYMFEFFKIIAREYVAPSSIYPVEEYLADRRKFLKESLSNMFERYSYKKEKSSPHKNFYKIVELLHTIGADINCVCYRDGPPSLNSYISYVSKHYDLEYIMTHLKYLIKLGANNLRYELLFRQLDNPKIMYITMITEIINLLNPQKSVLNLKITTYYPDKPFKTILDMACGSFEKIDHTDVKLTRIFKALIIKLILMGAENIQEHECLTQIRETCGIIRELNC